MSKTTDTIAVHHAQLLVNQAFALLQQASAQLVAKQQLNPSAAMLTVEITVPGNIPVKSLPKGTGPMLLQRIRSSAPPEVDLSLRVGVIAKNTNGIVVNMTIAVTWYNPNHPSNIILRVNGMTGGF